jgi:hypothetical protein
LGRIARRRRWPLGLIVVGWWHLLAFGLCHYLTVVQDYHGSAGYLSIWVGELAGVWLTFRLCGGPRPADLPAPPLELLVRRIWIAYFVLAFNLGSLNTLRGHEKFEFFPAIATLASFAFIMLTVLLDRRYFAAVLVMFASGLMMAASWHNSYLIFAIAWCVVLNGVGAMLWREAPSAVDERALEGVIPIRTRQAEGLSPRR